MDKNSIVLFASFATELDPRSFIEVWEPFAKGLVGNYDRITLHETLNRNRSKTFGYLSQHVCDRENFRFTVLKGQAQSLFRQHQGRMSFAGGYIPVQVHTKEIDVEGDVKVVAFLSPSETDLSFYHRQVYRHLNIFKAHFETCTYSYIMEFFLQESEAPALVKELKARGIKAIVYKDTHVVEPVAKELSPLL